MIQGVPVSPGVAVARAYRINQGLARREPIQLTADALSAEVTRFDAACAAAGRELDAVVRRVTQQVGEEEAAIFRAHQLLLRDPAFVGKVRAAIAGKRIDAAAALQQTIDEYKTLFSHISDTYIQERMADLRDVVGRILAELARQEDRPLLDVDEPVILVAPEILPSQAMTFDRKFVAGILTETRRRHRPRRHPGPLAGHPGRVRPARHAPRGQDRRPDRPGRPRGPRLRQPRPGGRRRPTASCSASTWTCATG